MSTYLPASGAVAVPFVLEVVDVLNHPVVNLRQRQPLLRTAVDRVRDQVGVGEVPPSVPSRRALLRNSVRVWVYRRTLSAHKVPVLMDQLVR